MGGDKAIGALSFKGEKKHKKHKKRKHADLEGIQDDGPTIAGEAAADEGWLNPPGQAFVLGPLYLVCISPSQSAYASASSSNPNPCAIAIFPSPISPIARVAPAALSEAALETLNPDDVNHVFVCARVLDSHDKVTLRAANGRYLAATSVGEVSAEQEARGMQEEWVFEAVNGEDPSAQPEPKQTYGDSEGGKDKGKAVSGPVTSDGVYALRSAAYGKYASVEEVAGGKLELRCDSDSKEDGACHFLVRMQAEHLALAKKRMAEEKAKRGLGRKDQETGITILKPGQTLSDLEASGIRQSQTRGMGRLVTSAESATALKKARKEGRLAEELLDRRSKLKSDRYAR